MREDQFGQELEDRLEMEKWLATAEEMEDFLVASAIGVTVGKEQDHERMP